MDGLNKGTKRASQVNCMTLSVSSTSPGGISRPNQKSREHSLILIHSSRQVPMAARPLNFSLPRFHTFTVSAPGWCSPESPPRSAVYLLHCNQTDLPKLQISSNHPHVTEVIVSALFLPGQMSFLCQGLPSKAVSMPCDAPTWLSLIASSSAMPSTLSYPKHVSSSHSLSSLSPLGLHIHSRDTRLLSTYPRAGPWLDANAPALAGTGSPAL